jgi:DNA-binding response OmpR family regulator
MENHRRILLTDDDGEFRSILATWLVDEGFSVIEATCGDEAISLLRSGEFDILILDLRMPNGSGLDVLRFVQETSPGMHIVALSGFFDLELMKECKELGATFTLRKPYDLQELSAILAYMEMMIRSSSIL